MNRISADKVEAHVLTFNSEHTVEATLTYLSRLLERVLVLDGGSSDGTLGIISRFKGVELHHCEQAPEAYNYKEDRARGMLVEKAKAEWVFIIDSDELWEESFVVELPKLIEDNDAKAWKFDLCEFFDLEKKEFICYPDLRPRLIRNKGIKISGERGASFFLGDQNFSTDPEGVKLAKSRRLHFHWIDLDQKGNVTYTEPLPPEVSLIRHGQDLVGEKKSRDRFYDYDYYKKVQKENSAWTRKDERFIKLLNEAIEELFNKKLRTSIILDAGCGDGYSMDVFKDKGFEKVVGIDLNEEKLAEAKKHGHEVHCCTLEERIPFGDDYFDIIFNSHTLEHCFSLGKSLTELRRVLKPGGTMFVIVPYGNNENGSHLIKFLEEDYLRRRLKENGWRVTKCEFRTRVEKEQWLTCTKIKAGLEKPTLVQIETTSKCNARCVFCPHKDMKRPKEDMEQGLFERIIKDCKDAKIERICPFLNGELFMDKLVFERLKYINQELPLVRMDIFTNGAMLNEDRIRKLSEIKNIESVVLSLHSYDEKTCKERTGLNHNTIVENVKSLVKVRSEHSWFDKLHILSIDFGGEENAKFTKFWKKFDGIDNVFAGTRHNYKGDIETSYKGKYNMICPRTNHICILSSGVVALCCMDQEGEYSIGDIKKNTILEIFNSDKYKKYRNELKKDLIPCNRCTQG